MESYGKVVAWDNVKIGIKVRSRGSYTMKRMGIFIFYDEAGIVDKYIEVLLSSMQDILNRLLVIVNGSVQNEGYNKLKKYAQDIFIRENIGFDAGGYKDAFTKFIAEENLKRWDEIVLFNDTFYGPLYPWKKIFTEMEGTDVDFWGLSRHSGKLTDGGTIPSHIQSFFLVCRNSLISSPLWSEFWNYLVYPKTLQEAISNFEIHFSLFFTQNGFSSKALTDKGREYVGNPYLDYMYELVKDVKIPIIKIKALCFSNFIQVKKTFEHIAANTNYDLDLIVSHTKRIQKEGRFNAMYPFDIAKIEHFYNSHKKIFIYGCGNYGQGMALYFDYRDWKYEGFLVTKKTEDREDIFAYEDISIDAEDGVIVALGKKAFCEVYPYVRKSLAESQLLLPNQ